MITITATISLDGVLLTSSEPRAGSLADLSELPFDRLIVTLEPRLAGTDHPPAALRQSCPLVLVGHEPGPSGEGLRLTYARAAPAPR